MRILEIKNNLVKIAYDVNDNLALSGFVIIEDKNCPYVAQIMNLKTDAITNFAIVKLLFTFNDEGILKNYNGTIPSLNATVSSLPSSELLDIIPVEKPIILGELANQKHKLKIDKSILDNNLLICSNKLENTIRLINNLTLQIEDTKVIFDIDGQFDWEKKITFGKDFKLPLNYNTINFIYENDLGDLDAINKAVIQDIFLEVQEYVKTLTEGYLPFETFLNVVDAQYKELKIPQLALLKNKLIKYKELDAFAENLKDILNLSIEIEKNNTIVIDISNISSSLQKEVISYVYSVMKTINTNIYSFVKINNDIADKKLLKTLIEKTNVSTIIICPHEFKYISELKENAQNMIAFMPLTVQHDFASYNTFLNKLNPDEFIITGAHTQNIPLIITLEDFSNEEPDNKDTANDDFNDDFSDDMTFDDETKIEPVIPDTEIVEDTQEQENDETELIPVENNIEIVDSPIPNVLEAADEEYIPPQESYIEEQTNEDNTIDITDQFEEEPQEIISEQVITEEEPTHEELVEQVSKDVDRAFYEKLPEEETINFEPLEEELENRLSEDDLNLIDNFTDDEIQLAGDEPPEELPTENNIQDDIPMVPVFDAGDIELHEAPTLEPGDRVSTAKYGEGVVEKMIKYGNKMLCSIDFPNIGRRLLDPAMTEITKL